MKPTFKTTALAILVSLGAVACSSNSSHDGAQPVKVTKPAEAAKPAEATKPAEAAKPAEATKPVEAIKPVEAAKFNFKKEATLANGKEWRYIDFSDTSIASIVSGLKDGIDRHITGSHGVGAGIINFNKLSNYSTGEFTGLDKDETYSLDNNVFINGLYYHFINQPYSTYGFFSNKKLSELTELGSSDSFYVAKKNSDVDQFEGVYSGDVIAKITVEGAGDIKEIVKNDGKVTLNVKHNSTNDKFMVSGSINSNTVGEVKLLATDFEYGSAKGIATLQGVSGDYSVSSANNYKEVVGDVKIHAGSVLRSDVASENTEVIGYDAVFGGQLK